MEVNVVEGGKNLGPISPRHVFGDLIHIRPVIHMTIGIDNLHDRSFHERI
jgi:hypothetical protein